ncbi:MAG TPA: hypothetical protein VF549_07445 [Solirubrobacteraceae bacterium]
MSLQRGIDGSEPLRPEPITSLAGASEIRPATTTFVLATGTLACPDCDAPVAPDGPMTPADSIACPYCAHTAKVRDFLSLSAPTRPARVEVRVSIPARALAPRRTRS